MPSIAVCQARFARLLPYLERRDAQFVFGGLFALAFAPYNIVPVFLIAILAYYHGLRTAPSPRAATVRSFWFGYGFSISGTYWIAFSLLVDANKFGWLVPFSVLGLSAVMALWWALQGYVYAKLCRQNRLHDALVFACVCTLIECAKSYGIFGFPWNLNGYGVSGLLPFAQLASIAGVYGIGFVAVLVVAFFYHACAHPRAAILAAISVVLLYGWGVYRLSAPVEYTNTTVRLVQPNIPQNAKWNPDAAGQAMASLSTLSKQGGMGTPDLVIWPETAIPFTITPDADWKTASRNMVPAGSALITGAVRADEEGRVYNSVLFVKDGALLAAYDKHQLVPFGEFVPLRDVLPLDKITPGAQDFSKGPGATTIRMNETLPSMSPLVCYEAVFSQHAVDTDDRPDLLVNVTNDAWFGDSPGPYQHLAMAQMRAIEQGLPLIRVANTGISAIIAANGRIVAYMPLGQTGTLDLQVPASNTSSLYAGYGMFLILFPIVVLLHVCIATIRRKVNIS